MEDLEVKRWPTWSTKGSEKYKVGVKSPLKIYDCNELSYIISGKMEIECKKTGKMHLVQVGAHARAAQARGMHTHTHTKNTHTLAHARAHLHTHTRTTGGRLRHVSRRVPVLLACQRGDHQTSLPVLNAQQTTGGGRRGGDDEEGGGGTECARVGMRTPSPRPAGLHTLHRPSVTHTRCTRCCRKLFIKV